VIKNVIPIIMMIINNCGRSQNCFDFRAITVFLVNLGGTQIILKVGKRDATNIFLHEMTALHCIGKHYTYYTFWFNLFYKKKTRCDARYEDCCNT